MGGSCPLEKWWSTRARNVVSMFVLMFLLYGESNQVIVCFLFFRCVIVFELLPILGCSSQAEVDIVANFAQGSLILGLGTIMTIEDIFVAAVDIG